MMRYLFMAVSAAALAACATTEQSARGCDGMALGELQGLKTGFAMRGPLDMSDPVNQRNVERLHELQTKCGEPLNDPAVRPQSPKSG